MLATCRPLRGAGFIPATVPTVRLRRGKGFRPIAEAVPFPFGARANPGGTERSGTCACSPSSAFAHCPLSPCSHPPRWAAQVKAIEDLTVPSRDLSRPPEVSAVAKGSPRRHEAVSDPTNLFPPRTPPNGGAVKSLGARKGRSPHPKSLQTRGGGGGLRGPWPRAPFCFRKQSSPVTKAPSREFSEQNRRHRKATIILFQAGRQRA